MCNVQACCTLDFLIRECVLPFLYLQVIRILKELKQKYPDKELDQLVELANYYALLHQQKSRAFYRIQVAHMNTHTHPKVCRGLVTHSSLILILPSKGNTYDDWSR